VVDFDARYLESFVAVAQELNITRAAARLHLTQQAVSAQIQQLERFLDVILLVRTSRGVLLTPAGDELAAGAKTLLTDLADLAERVRRAADQQTGGLRLACCPYATALFATDVADALEASVPGLRVDLTSVRTPAEELELLQSGAADAAFMWLPIGEVGLHHAPVRADPRAVALPAGHRLAHQDVVTLADLADEPVLRPRVFTSEVAERGWNIDPRPDGSPAPLGPSVAQVEDCLLMVARGKGVWLAPEPLSRWAPATNICWVPIADADPADLAVVWTSHAPQAAIARLIAEMRKITGWSERHWSSAA
jgi:DNA-binding transcriptional LysR family regulator